MLPGWTGSNTFTGLTADGERIDDGLLERVADLGAVVDPTLGNDRSMHARMPTPPPLAGLTTRLHVTSFEELYARRLALYGRLREYGIPVVTGVDSGLAPAKRHGNAWRAVGDLVDGGYPLAEALAAATSVAAQVCGLAARTRPARRGPRRRYPRRRG